DLLRGAQTGCRGPPPACELLRIRLLPAAALAGDKITTARVAEHRGVFGAWRPHTAVAQRARRRQQAAAGARDHLIRRREMFESMIQNRPHAFGDGLILQMNALDAAVDRVVVLRGAVHAPVVALVRR